MNFNDAYYDEEKEIVICEETRYIAEDETTTVLSEYPFESFLKNRFEDEIEKSNEFILKYYQAKGAGENEMLLKRFYKAWLRIFKKKDWEHSYPENEIFPQALKKLAQFVSQLYDGMFPNSPQPREFQAILSSIDNEKIDTGYILNARYRSRIPRFNNSLISNLLIDTTTSVSQWYAFFRGEIPETKINWIVSDHPENHLWYFISKLLSENLLDTNPKQQWKFLRDVFLFNGEEIKSDFYKNHNYLNRKGKQKIENAFRILRN